LMRFIMQGIFFGKWDELTKQKEYIRSC
jgi:hypothetical protein